MQCTDACCYHSELFQYRMEPDQFKKEEKKVVLMKEKIPFYLSKFEKVVTENRGFSVGGAVSVYKNINKRFNDIND